MLTKCFRTLRQENLCKKYLCLARNILNCIVIKSLIVKAGPTDGVDADVVSFTDEFNMVYFFYKYQVQSLPLSSGPC